MPLLWLAGPLGLAGLEWLTLLTQFLPWAPLPLMVWALLWRTCRGWGLWSEVFGAEALLAAVACSQPWLPAEPAPMAATALQGDSVPIGSAPFETQVTFMTCNLGPRLDACDDRARGILDQGADVIAFQELWPAMANALLRVGAESHPYHAFFPLGMDGRGLLSRYPLSEIHWRSGEAQRELLLALVDTPIGQLEVGAVHLAQATAWAGPRDATARDIQAWLAEPANYSRVFLGDFNSGLNSPVTARLKRSMALEAHHDLDVLDRLRRDATFPVPGRYRNLDLGPFVRLDQIWRQETPEHWRFDHAWVGADTGSDHLPFLARLSSH